MTEKRIAVIDKKKCDPEKCGKECQSFCPRVRSGDDETVIIKKKAEISEELCIGCGICTKKCPKHAITIINLAHELDDPIHQYGKNTFRLYGLPVPQKGRVAGLLGANGIGKTTALKILSAQITPNMANFEEKATWDAVLARFKGTEIYNYLLELKEKKIKAIYKPQQVDMIPSMFKGKVKEILKDERKILKKIAKDLEIDHILDRKVTEISGGDLQRVAIAAAIIREGDFYFFDEPSSYLDVRHRLMTARAIRELAEEKAVLVVEHDLATLDFLTDVVNIVYGHPSVYGVISSLYPARRGINTYLSGYIRESNVRFRDDELNFKSHGQIFKGKTKLIEYPDLEKKYPEFELKVDGGKFYAGEIVGVFGANALGKTTFMKMLAGVEAPTKGKLEEKIAIAYKPQYLKTDFKGTVQDLLATTTKKFGTQKYKLDVLRPLELEGLLENDVETLSGGELQRVSIAIALSKDADIYLLDEPSAYLDVEQRVKLSKMIRRFIETNKKTCIVIDHDMLMLNYISDRAIIVLGKSGERGHLHAPTKLADGMNIFLKDLGITFRKDPESGRPRANKPDSQKDKEQKKKNEFYCG